MSNAAANPTVDNILDTKEETLDKLWEINVKASILLLQVSSLCLTFCHVPTFWKFLQPLFSCFPPLFFFKKKKKILFNSIMFAGCCTLLEQRIICYSNIFYWRLSSSSHNGHVWCHQDCSLWAYKGILCCVLFTSFNWWPSKEIIYGHF